MHCPLLDAEQVFQEILSGLILIATLHRCQTNRAVDRAVLEADFAPASDADGLQAVTQCQVIGAAWPTRRRQGGCVPIGHSRVLRSREMQR